MKYPIIQITNEQKLAVEKFNVDEKIKFEEINCLNCESKEYKILFKNDRYGINQQTVGGIVASVLIWGNVGGFAPSSIVLPSLL